MITLNTYTPAGEWVVEMRGVGEKRWELPAGSRLERDGELTRVVMPMPLTRKMVFDRVGNRSLCVWRLERGQRVSLAIEAAVAHFVEKVGRAPEFAWIRVLPRGAENGMEVGGVTLIESEYAPRGFVVVG